MASKKLKKERQEYFENNVLPLIETNFDVRIVANAHFRVFSRINDRAVDYFPQSQRMFLLKEQKWGEVNLIELEEKLNKYLKLG